ncbi:baculoviral IAP repeat-containing protein 8-like [Corticium candelabrum]|uniref:baculoviral IAP repeat-containing protein 8-like n=1 Tax=Corticium candelabrum TaxID=121492 RepID=UPI002E264D47|nr:baculoviral IAP repeat-containing protein 8-like [Corticium candelabrum]
MGCTTSLSTSETGNPIGGIARAPVRVTYGTSFRQAPSTELGDESLPAKTVENANRTTSRYQIFKFNSGDEIPVCVQAGGGKFYVDPDEETWKSFPLAWYGHGNFFNCSSTRAEEVFQFNRFRKEVDRRSETNRTIEKLEERLKASESHRRRLVKDALDVKQSLIDSKKLNSDDVTALRTRADEMLCKVCFESEMDVLLMPCRHLVVCQTCSELLDDCPTCRGKINAVERVYRN